MRSDTLSRIGRTTALLLVIVFLFAVFLLGARPWYRSWGATDAELATPLPGDELMRASSQSTRAITIDAPVAHVWAWLTQLGQDRGGFYSYELLEDLVGAQMENVDELSPALQHWQVGDKLWMYPHDKLEGAGHAVLLRLDPERALVFGTHQIGTPPNAPHDGSWSFVVQPIDGARTRLLVRSRASGARTPALHAFDQLVFEPMHFVMERKMLEGIKARAEGNPPSPVSDAIEVSVFAACFFLFLAAVVRLVRWPDSLPELAMVFASGLTFQLLTFLQPPWIVGALLVAALGMFVGGSTFTARDRPGTVAPST